MLLEAALKEFSIYNFESASLNRVIKESATSKGSFYYHFENKDDLYIQLLQMSAKAKWEFINTYTQEHEADFSKMDMFDKFLYQAKASTVFGHKHPMYSKLGVMFSKEKGTDIYERTLEKLNADTESILINMIKDAYKAGEFKEEFSEAFVVTLVTFLFESFSEIFSIEANLDEELRNLKSYVSFMKRGLKNI